MEPFRPMTFDNRPVAPVFLDSNPVTDGVANFAAALMNAGPAANQIKQQREAVELGRMWKEREWERQTQQDKLAALWHAQAQERQAANDKRLRDLTDAQIANYQADNAGAFLEGLSREGRGWMDSFGKLFGGGGHRSGGNGNKVVRLADGSTVMVDKDGNRVNDIGDPKGAKPIDIMAEYAKAQKNSGIDPIPGSDQTENDKTIITNLQSLGDAATPSQKALLKWLQQKYQNSPSAENAKNTDGNTWAWPAIAGIGGVGAIEGAAYLADKGKPATAFQRKPVTPNVNPVAKTAAPNAAPVAQQVAPGGASKVGSLFRNTGNVASVGAGLFGAGYFGSEALDPQRGAIERSLSAAAAPGSAFLGATPFIKGAGTKVASLANLWSLPLTIGAGLSKSAVEHEFRDRDTTPAGILIDYGMGRVSPYLGTLAKVNGALWNGDMNFEVNQAKTRTDELLHAINVMLPEARTPQQAQQRERILQNFKLASMNAIDGEGQSRLQGLIQATFPWVTEVNRGKTLPMGNNPISPALPQNTRYDDSGFPVVDPNSMNGMKPTELTPVQKLNRLFTGQ
jgi:hypothetical protein